MSRDSSKPVQSTTYRRGYGANDVKTTAHIKLQRRCDTFFSIKITETMQSFYKVTVTMRRIHRLLLIIAGTMRGIRGCSVKVQGRSDPMNLRLSYKETGTMLRIPCPVKLYRRSDGTMRLIYCQIKLYSY